MALTLHAEACWPDLTLQRSKASAEVITASSESNYNDPMNLILSIILRISSFPAFSLTAFSHLCL